MDRSTRLIFFWSFPNCSDNEKRLIKKCRELNSEIVSNAAKVQSALRMGEEDKSTISTLKGEIEKAWRIVDESQLREKKSKETIVRLREEMTDLSRIVEEGGGNLTSSQQNTMNELLKQKEEVTKERDDMVRNKEQRLSRSKGVVKDQGEKRSEATMCGLCCTPTLDLSRSLSLVNRSGINNRPTP